MRRLLSTAILAFATAFTPVQAAEEDTGLKKLNSLNGTRGWQGVGRLNIGNSSFCTGTLIAPDLVLTAAHCLFNPRSGLREDDAKVEFLAGWSGGRAAASRKVKRSIVHPDYNFGAPKDSARVASDLALVQLDNPIRHPVIRPFGTIRNSPNVSQVRVVSYARGRDDAPSIQRVCNVLDREQSIYVTSCDVDFGSSGAPVFHIENGVPKVIAVVSAKAQFDDQKISLTAGLEGRLSELLDIVERNDGVFRRELPKVRKLSSGTREITGALFVKP